MAVLHDRMPVILEAADWPAWLGETATARRPRMSTCSCSAYFAAQRAGVPRRGPSGRGRKRKYE